MVLKPIVEAREEFEKRREEFIKAIKEIAKKYGAKCYLFGSRAKGTNLESSDLDVLIVVPKTTWKKRMEIYDEMTRACNDNPFVEIHLIDEESFEETKKLYSPLIPLD